MDEQSALRKKIADTFDQVDELNRTIRRVENSIWLNVFEEAKATKTNEKQRDIMFDMAADSNDTLQQLYAKRRNLNYILRVDTCEADSLQREHELLILELRK